MRYGMEAYAEWILALLRSIQSHCSVLSRIYSPKNLTPQHFSKNTVFHHNVWPGAFLFRHQLCPHRKGGTNNRQSLIKSPNRMVRNSQSAYIVDLFCMAVAMLTLMMVCEIAVVVGIGVVIWTKHHANPDEPILPPNETTMLLELLQSHNLTDDTTTMTWAELQSAVLVIYFDPNLMEVLFQRTIHHLLTAEPWSQALGLLISLIIVRNYRPWESIINSNDDSNNNNNKNPEGFRRRVAAALKRRVVLVVGSPCSEDSNNDNGTTGMGVCSICLDGLHPAQQNVVQGECQHAFHDHCISNWLCRGGKSHAQCPICRQDFLGTGTTRELRNRSYWSGHVVSS
jgi:Anaphase-promoting complex subunit 11 RING-H2 finger